MRLNHWMPAIFTTVAIFLASCAEAGIASIEADAASAAMNLIFFMLSSLSSV
ncbi:hypothetical protein D3C76_1631780 [compost metagenome]